MAYDMAVNIDEEESFVRYIYEDIRDELKNLWKTMLTLLGMLGVALGYLFKGADKIAPLWQYLIAAQLLWLFAMIEILLFSNYISKNRFLMEIEENFDPELKENSEKIPFWQTWVSEESFSGWNGYTISVLCIAVWSFLAFLGAAIKALSEGICSKDYLGIFWVVVIVGTELLAAVWASRKTCQAYREAHIKKADNSKN